MNFYYFCGAGVLAYFLWLKWMFDHAPQDPNDNEDFQL